MRYRKYKTTIKLPNSIYNLTLQSKYFTPSNILWHSSEIIAKARYLGVNAT